MLGVEGADRFRLNQRSAWHAGLWVTASQPAISGSHASSQQFVLWGLAVLRDALPEGLPPGGSNLRFDIAASGVPYAHIGGSSVAVAENDPGLFQWLVARLQTRGTVLHAQPRGDDASSEVLAAALVTAYDFAAGDVELVTCAIEPRPVLRLTFLRDTAGGAPPLRQAYVWNDGEELDDSLVRALRLDDLAPLAEPPAALDAQRVRRWIDTSLVRERRTYEPHELGEFVVATLIWCRYATGKIAFHAGEAAAEVAFSGWARPWADGDELPPPYVCPLTGVASRQLGVTTDGRIAPREMLGECQESHRIVLLSELDRCSESRQQVLRELLAPCMATGKLVQKRLLQTCSQCNQPTAASAMHGGRCSACRKLNPVHSDDPRMARVLGEYPKLDRWRRWWLSETESTYLLVTRSLVRQVLLVVHKESLSILYAAVAGRIWSPWQEMTQLQRDDLLG